MQEPTPFDLLRALVMGSSDACIVSAQSLSEDQRKTAREEGRLVTLDGEVAIVFIPGTSVPPRGHRSTPFC